MMKKQINCLRCDTPLQLVFRGHQEITAIYSLPSMKYAATEKYEIDPERGMRITPYICPTCGYIEFYSSRILGIVDSEGNAP